MSNPSVRVRFAPSPTGYLHVGGARTALFNFLFARHHHGRFLLRIEDTDAVRSSQEMSQAILDSLGWMGLTWDEPPLVQSTRLERHREICRHLVEINAAYPCFCPLDKSRIQKAENDGEGREYVYDGTCRNLSPEQSSEKIASGMSHAVRFRVPPGETVFEDGIRGRVSVQNKTIGDFVILRSDGNPVYQAAVVVDDHDMGITHVIRGEDHLSNTPKQIMLYRALGWTLPEFAHVPMILGPDRQRLSKRHGATSVEEFRKSGLFAEAFVNFLALLGWSPDDNREILSMSEMVEAFSLKGISKSAAVFDMTKLTWMNGEYIGRMTDDVLCATGFPALVEAGLVAESALEKNRATFLRFFGLMKSRMKNLGDFARLGGYFFKDPIHYEDKAAAKHWSNPVVSSLLRSLSTNLESLSDWTPGTIETTVRKTASDAGISDAALIHASRLALTGFGVSPGLFELMEILGKETAVRRLDRAIVHLEGSGTARS